MPTGRRVSRAGASDVTQQLAAAAMAEIEAQLWEAPPSGGRIWVSGWNERYLRHLGPLRTFLASHPEHFVVHSGHGKGYSVSMAPGAPGVEGVPAAARQQASRAYRGRWAPRQGEA